MRIVFVLLALAFFAAPASAQFNQAPRKEPRECRRLTHQIERYQGDIKRARQRRNDLWERAMSQQVDRLSARREERCPQYRDPKIYTKLFAKLIDVASEAAWKYFTWNY
jgi:hypothetical protein